MSTDCKSAQEVWECIRRAKAFRDSLMPRPAPQFVRAMPEPEPEPPPEALPMVLPQPVVIEELDPEMLVKRGMRTVVAAVSRYCRISRRELMGRGREQYIVEARFLAFILIRLLYRKSTTEIGNFFRNRDHTTILHGLLKYERTTAYIKAKALERPLGELVELSIFLMRIEATTNGLRFPQYPR
jgi:hypothetical protein